MNLREYSKENINRRYCDVTGIKEENIRLESFPIKTLKKNWILLLGVVAVIIGLLLIRFDFQSFLVVFGFAIVFTGLFILGNKYSVLCNYEGLKIKQHFQTITIPNKNIKNVYVSPTIRGVISTYILVICCEDQLNLLREFELPLLCADKDEAIKFVENFKLAGESDTDKLKLDKKRSFKRIVGFLFKLTSAIIIVAYLILNGIIKLPQ